MIHVHMNPALVFLILFTLCALGVAFLADSRGRSLFGFFAISLLLSPIIGLIIVLLSRDLKVEAQRELQRREDNERQLESIKALSRHVVVNTPTPSAAPPQADAPSVADELTKLAGLRDRGILSEAEFITQKSIVLARSGH